MGKLSLYFVSSTDLSSSKAQSVQIPRMALALSKQVEDFCLMGFSYSGQIQEHGFTQRIFPRKYPKPVRNFKIIKAVHSQAQSPYCIYTRDLFFAIYFTLIGKPTLWECHQNVNKKTRLWLKLLGHFSNFSVLSITNKLAEQIPLDANRNFVYHSAAELPEVEPTEKPVLKPNTALYTGALHKGKDVESLEPLFTAHPQWTFVIAGGRPSEIERYREKFSDYSNVEVIGRIPPDQVRSYQLAADLLLYPLTKTSQYWDVTSPLKLFEYLSTGRPILASRIGPIKDIISDSNAFTFSDDDSMLAAFNHFLATDKDTLQKMSERNQTLIREHYNWDSRAQFIVEGVFGNQQ